MKAYTPQNEMSIASIPPSVLRTLTPRQISILDAMYTLWAVHRRMAPNYPRKAWCSLEYLAKKAECSPFTVSRAISKFREMKIIIAYQRRKGPGLWATNNYHPGKAMISWVKVYCYRVEQAFRRRLRFSASKLKQLIKERSLKEQIVDKSMLNIDFALEFG